MQNSEFIEKMRVSIRRFGLLKRDDTVLVALSSGPDSVALLYGLLALKPEYELKLFVAHLNHRLRGGESDEDQRFARNLASSQKLKFFTKKVDVKKEAKRRKLSIEETAREVRYRYLEQLAEKIGADKIALGHQADDQAETFLMRLIRGAGASGLGGIPAKRGKIIRPLMQVNREEIERFLKANRIPYRLDSSNYLTDYSRNKIRLLLLPRIRKEFNPKIVESLNRAADIISLQQEYIRRKSEQNLKRIGTHIKDRVVVNAGKFAKSHACLQREMIRLCVKALGEDADKLSFELINRALYLAGRRKSGRQVKLVKNVWFEVGGDQLVFYVQGRKPRNRTIRLPGRLNLKDWGLKIKSEMVDGKSKAVDWSHTENNVAFLDWTKLKPPFVLRSRRRGDRFRPLGMKGTKSVADFLIDAKIPRHLRDELPVLTSKGEIVWLVGQRISDRFKVTKNTKKVLKLEVKSSNLP